MLEEQNDGNEFGLSYLEHGGMYVYLPGNL